MLAYLHFALKSVINNFERRTKVRNDLVNIWARRTLVGERVIAKEFCFAAKLQILAVTGRRVLDETRSRDGRVFIRVPTSDCFIFKTFVVLLRDAKTCKPVFIYDNTVQYYLDIICVILTTEEFVVAKRFKNVSKSV